MKKLLLVFFAAIVLISCSKKGDDTTPEPAPTVTTVTNFAPKTATTGTLITITGNNFGSNAATVSVKFGNSAAVQPQTVESGKITVIVPADATSGRIAVLINNVSYYSSENFSVAIQPN